MIEPIKILIAEDRPEDVDLITSALSGGGINFVRIIAETRNEFVEALISSVPDVIISDYSLLNFGWAKSLSIRNELAPLTPFIVITGSDRKESVTECTKAGVTDYIGKSKLSNLPRIIKDSLTRRNALLLGLKPEPEYLSGIKKPRSRKGAARDIDLIMKGLNENPFKEPEQNFDNLMRFDLVVESARMGLSSFDILRNKRLLDKQACTLLGINPDSFRGSEEEFFKTVHPDDRQELKSLIHISITKGKDYEAEYRVIWEDGSLHYIVSRARIIKDEENKSVRFNGLIWDITDQKLLEINLHENLRKMNSIINNLNGAVFRCRSDDEMTMEYISQGVEAITGYPSWDFLMNRKRSYYSLIVESDKDKTLNGIGEAIKNGSQYNLEYRIRSSSGETRWISERGHGVSIGKNLIVIEGFLTEVTEKKEIESKLKRSLKQLQQLNQYLQTVRERERLAISRELHDDLGQALTAVKIDLGTLLPLISNPEEARTKIGKISSLVGHTIKTVQNITAQLRPQIIDDLGLEAAIEWYTGDFSERTGIEIHLKIEPVLNMPKGTSLIVFRILQESLTNIARHSKATKAEITFLVHEKSILLNINDNGVGISENETNSKQSFGLISMRERAISIGGNLQITAPEKGGTTVSLIIPNTGKKNHENFNL
jgi:two-component system, NarL family, sensor histidine kinase UhpB